MQVIEELWEQEFMERCLEEMLEEEERGWQPQNQNPSDYMGFEQQMNRLNINESQRPPNRQWPNGFVPQQHGGRSSGGQLSSNYGTSTGGWSNGSTRPQQHYGNGIRQELNPHIPAFNMQQQQVASNWTSRAEGSSASVCV